MALLWIDGFDGATDTNSDAGNADVETYLQRMYDSTASFGGNPGPMVYDGWGGGKALSFGDDGFADNNWIRKAFTATGTVIFGFAMKMGEFLGLGDTSNTSRLVARIRNVGDSAEHIRVYIVNQRHVRIDRVTTQLGIATDTVRPGQFNYIEVKVAISNTVGTVDVQVNGQSVLSLTNQDTRNGGTVDQCDTIELVGVDGASQEIAHTLFDDFYICDTSGSANNDFLGPLKVEELHPNGAGNSAQFTPSTGANWECVDETPANDDTDYVSESTANDKDTHTMTNLANIDGTIYGVQVDAITRVEDATTHTHTNIVRRSTSEANGAGPTISSTTFVAVSDIFEQDPAAGPGVWTVTNVNAMEAGYEVD